MLAVFRYVKIHIFMSSSFNLFERFISRAHLLFVIKVYVQDVKTDERWQFFVSEDMFV